MQIYGSDDLKYYYTNIYVGTPPQRQSVIIDTGSDYLAFPCSRCQKGECGNHNNPSFDLMKDSTARLIKCHEKLDHFTCNSCNPDGNCGFSKSYLEGSSLRGEVYEDYIRLFAPEDLQTQENVRRLPNGLKKKHQETIHKHDLKGAKGTFGCTMQETGLFKTQLANGIMGLSPLTDSAVATPNFIDSLFIDHKVKNRNFSVCLGTNGGYLTFGGYNVNKHKKGEPIQTVPYTGEYHIKFDLPSIGVANKKLHKDGKNLKHLALLDSGTTFTYLLDNVFNPIAQNFSHWCSTSKPTKGRICGGKPVFTNRYCVDYKKEEYGNLETFFTAFPKLFFPIANKGELIWFPKDYFELSKKHTDTHMTFCSSFNKENSGSNQFSTFGSLFFRHYDIYFNRTKKQVSFVRSECEDKSERAYPIRGIKRVLIRAKVMMGSLLGSSYGLFGICLGMIVFTLIVSMRYGITEKFVNLLKSDKDLEKTEASKEKSQE